MHTNEDDARRIENNPDLLHVSIVDGKLWLSDDAKEDIHGFVGQCLETDNPRQMLAFLAEQCQLLQARDAVLGGNAAERNFMAFCVLRGIVHAIETRLIGADVVGDFRADALVDEFCRPQIRLQPVSILLH